MIDEIQKYIRLQVRRFQLGMENRDILIHGFRNNKSSFWREKDIRDRIDYALKNGWVLKYDFGHRELIYAAVNRVV